MEQQLVMAVWVCDQAEAGDVCHVEVVLKLELELMLELVERG